MTISLQYSFGSYEGGDMLEIGSVVDGKYKILDKIGQGGMSVVYLARNERTNKSWAIKDVRKDGVKDFEVVRQGLIAETDILKKLDHPHLPQIIDIIDSEDSFIIIMDYIEGNSLKDLLDHNGAQAQEDVVEWGKQLCDVLGYLHSRTPAIIYRDMKPSNVMLKPDGNVMLIDFGTAREFKATSVEDTTCLGTQGYAAPEQYGGHGQTDARTDIYCLGATLYHLVTGHNPSKYPYEMYPIRKWNPQLSSGLEQIILKCTQRNPNDRYQSCAELMYALENYDKLDLEYIRRQNKKLRAFAVSSALTAACALGALGCKGMEWKTENESYNAYYREAQSAVDEESKIENYEKAIALNPEKSEAYLGLLENAILDDGEMTSDEDKILHGILYGVSEGQSRQNIECLKRNEDEYGQVAYQLGLAYFYYYGASGDKASAAAWFADATEYGLDNSSQMNRAELLGRVASYYNDLQKENKDGDARASYLEYWDDLVELTEGNIVEADNTITALRMYNELVNQVATNAGRFKDAGVSASEMRDKLQDVQSHIDNEVATASDANSENVQSLIRTIEENIRLAEQAVDNAFNNAVEGGNENG